MPERKPESTSDGAVPSERQLTRTPTALPSFDWYLLFDHSCGCHGQIVWLDVFLREREVCGSCESAVRHWHEKFVGARWRSGRGEVARRHCRSDRWRARCGGLRQQCDPDTAAETRGLTHRRRFWSLQSIRSEWRTSAGRMRTTWICHGSTSNSCWKVTSAAICRRSLILCSIEEALHASSRQVPTRTLTLPSSSTDWAWWRLRWWPKRTTIPAASSSVSHALVLEFMKERPSGCTCTIRGLVRGAHRSRPVRCRRAVGQRPGRGRIVFNVSSRTRWVRRSAVSGGGEPRRCVGAALCEVPRLDGVSARAQLRVLVTSTLWASSATGFSPRASNLTAGEHCASLRNVAPSGSGTWCDLWSWRTQVSTPTGRIMSSGGLCRAMPFTSERRTGSSACWDARRTCARNWSRGLWSNLLRGIYCARNQSCWLEVASVFMYRQTTRAAFDSALQCTLHVCWTSGLYPHILKKKRRQHEGGLVTSSWISKEACASNVGRTPIRTTHLRTYSWSQRAPHRYSHSSREHAWLKSFALVLQKQFVIPASCLTCCRICHRTLLHDLSLSLSHLHHLSYLGPFWIGVWNPARPTADTLSLHLPQVKSPKKDQSDDSNLVEIELDRNLGTDPQPEEVSSTGILGQIRIKTREMTITCRRGYGGDWTFWCRHALRPIKNTLWLRFSWKHCRLGSWRWRVTKNAGLTTV